MLKYLLLASTITIGVHVDATASSFLAMGDWGGIPKPPYTKGRELRTAAGVGKIALELQSKFMIGLGDNFYWSGIPTDAHDPRFNQTFENVFNDPYLLDDFTFHMIAGNHDHVGNITAEIAYSDLSSRWSYPSLYYDFYETLGDDVSVHYVMLDTVILSGNSHGVDNDPNVSLDGDELPGPLDPLAADAQLVWLEKTLEGSTGDYIIVSGHYPLYSICAHGPTVSLQPQLLPMLQKYNVSTYLNGHDHCAQHIDVGFYTQFHTIGSAEINDNDTSHNTTISPAQLKFHKGDGRGGFASIAVDKQGLVVTHRDGDGTVLYTAPAILPVFRISSVTDDEVVAIPEPQIALQ